MMPPQGPIWLLPRQEADGSPDTDHEAPSDDRMTMVAAGWMLCAVGSGYWSLITGSFGNWHPLILLGLVKAVIVAALGLALGRRRGWVWATGVVVPALYGSLGCALLIWMVVSLFLVPQIGGIDLVQSMVLVVLHAAFVLLLSRTVWVSSPAFKVPKHLRWRHLVRRGIPVALGLLLVDVLDATRFYWR